MKDPAINVLSIGFGRTPAHATDNNIIKKHRNLDTLPSRDFSMHAHHYCKLFYVTECDSFSTMINDCKIEFTPGYIYYLPAYTLHTPTNHYSGSISTIAMSFFVEDKDFAIEIENIPFFLKCPESEKNLFFEILDEKNKNKKNFELFNTKAEELIIKLAKSPFRKNILRTKESDDENIEFVQLIKYINEHYAEDLSLSDLANFVHVEKTYFSKKFKSIYNITPINYLYSVRLSYSLDDLTFSDASIEEIALTVGFKRVSAYSSAFKRAYDISPNEYRKRAKRIWLQKKT